MERARRLGYFYFVPHDEGEWVAGVEASLNDHNERLESVETVHQSEQ
jgi:hypothetical protein